MNETTIDVGVIDNKPTIIRRLPDGAFHSMRKKLQLTAGEHWFPCAVQNEDGSYENKKALTARAYDLIRSVMGVSIVTPDTLVNADGQTVGNPYIQRRSGLVDSVQYRIFALGRGPAGNWSAVDLTFVYSVQAYIAHDLYLKWTGLNLIKTRDPEQKEWGHLIREDEVGDQEPGTIAFPIAAPGMFLCVDMNHKDVLPLWRDYQEWQKFAERNAHSMAVRNAMRKLTGITFADGDGSVELVVWPQGDIPLDELREQIGQQVMRIEGQAVTVETAVESAIDEDVSAASEPDEKSRESTSDESDVVTLPQETRDDIIKQVREAINKLPGKHESDTAICAARALGFDFPAQMIKKNASVEQLKKFLESIS